MYRVVIIDDELPAIDELSYLLSKDSHFEIVNTYTNPQDGLVNLLSDNADVLFLDIDMPGIKGYTIAEVISKTMNPPLIVFVTAHDDYAIKAFEVNAVDYILKPIIEDRFKSLLVKLKTQLTKLSEDNIIHRIPLWKGDKIHMVNISDIYFITNDDKDAIFHTVNSTFYKKINLSNLIHDLPGNFFRSHRNYILNLDNINEIIPWFNGTYTVRYKNHDDEIPVSRRNVKEFKDKIKL